MMVILDFPGDGTVQVEHMHVYKDAHGTIREEQHVSYVSLDSIKDGDILEYLVVPCGIDGCDTKSLEPLHGGRGQQLLHAAVRHRRGKHTNMHDTFAAMRPEIEALGGIFFLEQGHVLNHKTGQARPYVEGTIIQEQG